MEIRLTKPEEAVDYLKISAAYLNGVEIKHNTEDFFKAFPHRVTHFIDSCWSI